MDSITLMIIVSTAMVSFKGFDDYGFFRKYDFHIGGIRAGEWYRLFTSGFLHADIGHLFFNMFSLYMFAPVVIGGFSRFVFVVIYFISLFAGSLLTYFFYKQDFYYRAIGASGAVTGIIYSAILLQPDMSLFLFFIPIPIPAYLFGMGYLFYSIYGIKAQGDSIGHVAHFGGALGGYFFTIFNEPSMLINNTFVVVLLAIPIVVLYGLVFKRKI